MQQLQRGRSLAGLICAGLLTCTFAFPPSALAYKREARSLIPASAASEPEVATPKPTESEKKDAAQNVEAEAQPQEESKTELRDTVLDRRFRYSKRHQHEFSPFFGDYLGDEWLNNWDTGGRYFFHLNNAIAFGAEYMYSPIRVDSTSVFGESLTTKNTHTLDAQVIFSNEAAFRVGKSILECDLMLTVGGGSMMINDMWRWLAVVGGGIKLYTSIPWFAVRFDVNSYIHPTPKPGGDPINADMVINLGASFLFPQRTPEVPQKKVVTPE